MLHSASRQNFKMQHTGLLVLLTTLAITGANIIQGSIDSNRLQNIFEENLKSNDVSSLYHAIKGLKLLNAKIPDVCGAIKSAQVDLKNIEQVFYLTNAAALSGCLNSLKPEVLATPTQVLDKKEPSIPELYYAVFSLKAMGKGTVYDKEEALKNVIALLKKDDNPANYAYVFSLCEHMGCQQFTATHAETVLLTADETDSRLQFEGGLRHTSRLLTSVISSYKTLKKPAPLSESQRLKFAQYLVWRRAATGAHAAALLLDAALALAEDPLTPICITTKDRKYITSDQDSIDFSVTDILGRPVKGLKPEEVVAQSGTRLADDVVVLSKQPLVRNAQDPTIFTLNLSKIKSQYGLYKIALSAGGKTTSINISVLGEVKVSSVEIGVGDVDGTTSPKLTTINYPNKITEQIQADHMQKVTLKWTVRDKAGKPALVQQAFLRVAGAGDDEAIFVAEPDNFKTYKVELNVGTLWKHVSSASGTHSLALYIGDSGVSAPLAWPLGELHFNLPSAPDKPVARGGSRSARLPAFAHVSRAAEARPARLVSDAAALLAAAPLPLLLLLWARLNLNLRRLPLAPAPLVFHAALAGFFLLYWVVWTRLSMFESARYLAPLAAVTFLAGHRLLRRLAADNKR